MLLGERGGLPHKLYVKPSQQLMSSQDLTNVTVSRVKFLATVQTTHCVLFRGGEGEVIYELGMAELRKAKTVCVRSLQHNILLTYAEGREPLITSGLCGGGSFLCGETFKL